MTESPKLIEKFLLLCPEFRAKWDEHVAYWGDQERGEYTDIAEFAHFLVDSYAHQRTESFPRIFSEIERLLTEGDPNVKELVSVGLLEDIQTIASHHEFGSEAFTRWLEPTSRQVWYEIAKMWEGKSSLSDVIREEQQRRNDV